MTLFCSLDNDGIAKAINGATRNVILCTPGFTDNVAVALIEKTRLLGRANVRAVVDASDSAARLGYGYFDAIEQAYEADVDIRKEPGLRLSVLIVDGAGWCFALPPLLVEAVAEHAVAPNAVRLSEDQAKALTSAIAPQSATTSPIEPNTRQPEIGKSTLAASEIAETAARLESSAPQKFDLARKVMIFNAYVEFVEIELHGTQIGRRRVKVPQDLILAASDEATRKGLSASFELIRDESTLKREAEGLRRKVDMVRNSMAKSIGSRYGTIVLSAHRAALENRIESLQKEVLTFKDSMKNRLAKELEASRAQLIKSLVPVIKTNPPEDLKFSVTGAVTIAIATRYLERRLEAVFPKPDDLLGEMELTCTFKGVTYQTLNEAAFQKAVRDAFPDMDFDKPFEESVGVKVVQTGALTK